MRFALFADIHANLPALTAVLADIDAAEIDEVYCLGDLVGYGPHPREVIALMRDRGIVSVRGNHDDIGVVHQRKRRHTATRGRCDMDGAQSFRYTRAALSEAEIEWLSSLPTELRIQRGAVALHFVHGSLRRLNEGVRSDSDLTEHAQAAAEAASDIVCVAHTHVPYTRVAEHEGRQVRFVGVGSVGMPADGDTRACWIELEIGAGCADPTVRIHRCDYDVEGFLVEAEAAGVPSMILETLRGLRTVPEE